MSNSSYDIKTFENSVTVCCNKPRAKRCQLAPVLATTLEARIWSEMINNNQQHKCTAVFHGSQDLINDAKQITTRFAHKICDVCCQHRRSGK